MAELSTRPVTAANLPAARDIPRVAAAVLAALVAGAFVARGAGPAAELGGGVARLIPAADVLVAAVVAAVLVVRPWNGLLAWLVVMPLLNMARAQILFGSFQLIVTTILLVALVAGVAFEADRDALRSRTVIVAWAATGLVAGLAFASAVAAGAKGAGATIALHGLVEPAVLGALVVSLRPSRRRLLALLLALGASVSLASLYSVVRAGRVVNTVAQAVAVRTDLAHFTYYNVGIFGDLLAMALPATIVGGALLWLHYRSRLGVALAAVGAVLSVAALYLTFSKGAWLGAGIALFLLALLAVRRAWQRVAVVVAALLLAALVVPYPAWIMQAAGVNPAPYTQLVERFQGTRFSSWDPDTAGGEVSITERVLAMDAAVAMTRDHPLLGVGPGGFGPAYAGRYHPKQATRLLDHPHDMVANLASEYGLPMAILVVLVLVAAFGAAFAVFRRDGPLGRGIAVALIASLAGFVVVASTFGLDLYRRYRFMNSDVLVAAVLVAAAVALWTAMRAAPETAAGVDSAAPGSVEAE